MRKFSSFRKETIKPKITEIPRKKSTRLEIPGNKFPKTSGHYCTTGNSGNCCSIRHFRNSSPTGRRQWNPASSNHFTKVRSVIPFKATTVSNRTKGFHCPLTGGEMNSWVARDDIISKIPN